MLDPEPRQHRALFPGPPKLNHQQLLVAQQETLDTPRRSYGRAARVLFRALDAVYLLILQEMIDNAGIAEKTIKFYWFPQALALAYYRLSWFLFVLRPDWSYLLNADFEDHAEHEYMEFVA